MIRFDGHTYATESDVPDMGSIVCVASSGNRREYIGYTSDESKLPTYDDLGEGSSASLYDSTDGGLKKILTYFADAKKWIEN